MAYWFLHALDFSVIFLKLSTPMALMLPQTQCIWQPSWVGHQIAGERGLDDSQPYGSGDRESRVSGRRNSWIRGCGPQSPVDHAEGATVVESWLCLSGPLGNIIQRGKKNWNLRNLSVWGGAKQTGSGKSLSIPICVWWSTETQLCTQQRVQGLAPGTLKG